METATYYRLDSRGLPFSAILQTTARRWRSNDPQMLPAFASRKIMPLVCHGLRLGFLPPWFVLHYNELSPFIDCFAIMRHGSGNAVAHFAYHGAKRERTVVSFITPLNDGGWAISGNGIGKRMGRALGFAFGRDNAAAHAHDINSLGNGWVQPPQAHPFRFARAACEPGLLWEFHKRKVALLRRQELIPAPLEDDARLFEFCDALERTVFQWGLKRGVFVPLTHRETEQARFRAQAARETLGRLEKGGTEHLPVFFELAKLPVPGGCRSRDAISFVLGFFLLTATGLGRLSDPVFLCLFAEVLLFHQSGHWSAARLLGRRGPPLFSSPLFGDTARGRFLDCGWKAGVVFLMGPLPGIVAGTVALCVVLLWNGPAPQWVALLAELLLILNFLTLLPLLPGDGQSLLQLILLRRNRWLEPALRIAVALLCGVAAWKLDSLPLGLAAGCLLVIGIPRHLRLSAIAKQFRQDRQNFSNVAAPPCALTPETVSAMIQAVKKGMPEICSPRAIAATVHRICEATMSQSPGWRTSVGMALLYGFMWLLPLVPAGVYLATSPRLNELVRLGMIRMEQNQPSRKKPVSLQSPQSFRYGREAR